MATHSSILTWRIPWTEEPGRLHIPWGHKESDTMEVTEHGATHTQGELVWFFGFHCRKRYAEALKVS